MNEHRFDSLGLPDPRLVAFVGRCEPYALFVGVLRWYKGLGAGGGSPEDQRTCGDCGNRHHDTHFTPQIQGEKYLAIYRTLLQS